MLSINCFIFSVSEIKWQPSCISWPNCHFCLFETASSSYMHIKVIYYIKFIYEHEQIGCCVLHDHQGYKGNISPTQLPPNSYFFNTSDSPLFSGTGLRCCWSAGQEHCGSPPECGRHTHSSSVRTGAGAGSWLLMWSAWSPRPGCRSGLRVESEGSPAELEKKKDSLTLTLKETVM